MYAPIDEQVIDFYHALFERVFSEPFRPRINDRLKRNALLERAIAERAKQQTKPKKKSKSTTKVTMKKGRKKR